MRNILVVFLLGLGLAVGGPIDQRIIGGSVTTIDNYPEMGVMLYTADSVNWVHGCGSSILNNRAILTAAHCVHGSMRVRLGSAFGSSGGTVYIISRQFIHPNYNAVTIDNDIAVLHVSSEIIFVPNAVRPASIAGPNYNIVDDMIVMATGWGSTGGAMFSEQLRHVQIRTINQEICRQRYFLSSGHVINDNMVCAGILDVGGIGQCGGDSGSPLFHNGNVIGLCSFGPRMCGDSFLPSVNVRIPRFTNWIVNNA